jgi:hypothetical protein
MILVADGPPEGNSCRVADQNLDRQSFVLRPDFCDENFHGLAAKALPAVVSHDEQLPQIPFLRLMSLQLF